MRTADARRCGRAPSTRGDTYQGLSLAMGPSLLCCGMARGDPCTVCGSTVRTRGSICCSVACSALRRGSFEERFWLRVKKSKSCWEWQGRVGKLGYARIRRTDRSRVFVHRLSYEMHHGPVPEGLLVLHTCDNRRCVNPKHLYVGTHQDNTDDMFRRGRANKAQGERHGNAKLSDAEARRLVDMFRAGEATVAQLAVRYNLHPVHVDGVIKGRRRKHLHQS